MIIYFTKDRISQGILWLLVLIWLAVIFSFSASTAPESNAQSGKIIRIGAELMVPEFKELSLPEQEAFIAQWQHIVRKSAHGLAYCVLGLLSSLAVLQQSWPRKKHIGIALAVPYVYAVLDEIHQLFVSGRAFMFTDIGIDIAAASIGVMMTLFFAGQRGATKY